MLRLLRDAEHRRQPLPLPVSDDPDNKGYEANGDEDSSSDEEDEDEDERSQDHEGDSQHSDAVRKSRKDRMMSGMAKTGKKVGSGVRGKLRRTWDKLGHEKEEVSRNDTHSSNHMPSETEYRVLHFLRGTSTSTWKVKRG